MNGAVDKRTGAQLDLFYNTTHLTAAELKIRRQDVRYQNGRILKFFEDNPEGYFTPFEVQDYSNLKGVPITSIRRALNTLTPIARSTSLTRAAFLRL